MRKLTTQTTSITLSAVFQTYLQWTVPANWWADEHEIVMAAWITTDGGGVAPPAGLHIQEMVTNNQLAPTIIFPEGDVHSPVGSATYRMPMHMVRLGADIVFYWDQQLVPDHTTVFHPNDVCYGLTGVTHGPSAWILAPPPGGWHFDQELQFGLQIQNIGAAYAWSIAPRAFNAYISPALNVRGA